MFQNLGPVKGVEACLTNQCERS